MLRMKIVATALLAAAAIVAVPESADAGTFDALPLAHGTYAYVRARNYHHRYRGSRHRGHVRVHAYHGGPDYHYRTYRSQPHANSYGYSYPHHEYRRPSRATTGVRTGYRRYDGGHHSFRRTGVRYSGYRRGFP